MSNRILEALNEEQREAARRLEGPILVLAGAGTGKTRVITYRVAHMIDQGVDPAGILGMTFTNKAAREMRERVAALVSESDATAVTLGTFHSFCARLLRKEINRFRGYNSNFTIANQSDQQGILKQAVGELGMIRTAPPLDAVSAAIGKAKNRGLTPRNMRDAADSELEVQTGIIYERYQEMLENQNMLDFDDLLAFPVAIWEEKPDVLERYRQTYHHILVDEYQDTNEIQFRLLELLANPKNNICVVGDDDQSIYSWRGANVENILNFADHFPGATTVKLEQNYRSTNTILQAANHVIKTNATRYEKNLWSKQGEGETLKVVTARTAEAEAEFVAQVILDAKRAGDGFKHADAAVLYRSNHLSRQFEDAFRKNRIPYRVVGSKSFYERKEILDAVAYLKLLINPRDDQSLLRILGVPPRGIGDKAIKRLKELQRLSFMPYSEILGDDGFKADLSSQGRLGAVGLSESIKKHRKILSDPGNMAEKVKTYLNDVGYANGLLKIYRKREEAERRQENVVEFINAVAQFEQSFDGTPLLMDFIESFALLDDNDKTEESDMDAVTLMTVHAAKGLEFPLVFIAGAEQNLFPHERALQEGGEDEERRLFYVAVTRAKQRLIISHADSRLRFGKLNSQRPSEFLAHLPGELVEKTTVDDFFGPVTEEMMAKQFAEVFDILD